MYNVLYMNNNNTYNLLKNEPANVFSQALSKGVVKKTGNTLDNISNTTSNTTNSVFNTARNTWNTQVQQFNQMKNFVYNNSKPMAWVILFVLFFIIIII